MNWFASFAVLLTITQAPVPATGKTSDNGTRNGHTQNHRADTSNNPSATLVSPHTKDGYGPALKTDTNKDATNLNQPAINITNPAPVPIPWGWRERILWGANLILALVGIGGIVVAIVTLCFIKRQAIEMRRQRITMEKTLNAIRQQANHMERQTGILEKSVDAAEKSASISMNAERSWIIDQASPIANLPLPGIPFKAFVTLTNKGRVPARVTDLKIRFHMVDPYAEPYVSEHPTYDPEPFQFLELGTSGLVIAPQQSVIFSQNLEGLTLTAIQRELLSSNPPHLVLFLYGLATYNNGFESGLVTQFCYTWKGGVMSRTGPSGYNEAT